MGIVCVALEEEWGKGMMQQTLGVNLVKEGKIVSVIRVYLMDAEGKIKEKLIKVPTEMVHELQEFEKRETNGMFVFQVTKGRVEWWTVPEEGWKEGLDAYINEEYRRKYVV